MRLKCYALAISLLLSVGLASAQTMTVSGSNIVDSTGTPLASGTIQFAPVDLSGHPISYHLGGKGQALSRPVTATVTNGAFSIVLPDTSATNPVNVCFAVTVVDNVTGDSVLGSGYSCMQPSSTASNWCTSTACNFDNFTPNNTALPVETVGGGGTFTGGTVANAITAPALFAMQAAIPQATVEGTTSTSQVDLRIQRAPGTVDAELGVAGAAGQFANGSSAGDLIIKTDFAGHNIWFTAGGQIPEAEVDTSDNRFYGITGLDAGSAKQFSVDASGNIVAPTLTLGADPTQDLQAATKEYVDNHPGVDNYEGVYSASTNYTQGEIVQYNGNLYLSMVTPNQGDEPDTHTTAWGLLSGSGGSSYALPGATASALGGVQLASGQSSTTLAKVATTGLASDLSGFATAVASNLPSSPTFTSVNTNGSGAGVYFAVAGAPPSPGANTVGFSAPPTVTTSYDLAPPAAPPGAIPLFLSCSSTTSGTLYTICNWVSGNANLSTANTWTATQTFQTVGTNAGFVESSNGSDKVFHYVDVGTGQKFQWFYDSASSYAGLFDVTNNVELFYASGFSGQYATFGLPALGQLVWSNTYYGDGTGLHDVGLSRCGANCLALGNGSNKGSTTGTLEDTTEVINGTTITGGATEPTGSCSIAGEWALTNDGHLSVCLSGSWAAKI